MKKTRRAVAYTCLVSSLCLALAVLYLPSNASAITAADWKAGHIIDDSIFFNKDTMTPQQIQDFLNAKVPTCDRNHQAFFWLGGVYNQPPYTCLKEYNENPTTHENNIGRFNADGSPVVVNGGKSAAQIIWDAGQLYGINPQVLLVMLQKETSIVTDPWSATWQYNRAMGYACPDSGVGGSANCDTSYYGFYNQVTSAAKQMRRYVTYPDSYNFKAGVTRNIQWDVPSSCGSSPVYIETQGTAALYNYTPYQPNAMALSNLYGGQDDGCSAYGNRNFWVYFNDWFGVTSRKFAATYAGQSAYPTIVSGRSTLSSLRYSNAGSLPWYDDVSAPLYQTYPVHLATTQPINTASQFSSGWPANNRATGTFAHVYESDGVTLAPNQHIAQPGQIVQFDFTLTANAPVGTYREYFQPVLEGSAMWNMGGVAWTAITVKPVIFAAAFAGQSIYPIVQKGQSTTSFFRFSNSGTLPWYDDTSALISKTYPVHLATANPINNASPFSASWPTNNRASGTFSRVYEADGVTLAANQHVALPGQIAEFSFTFSVDQAQASGTYRQFFQPILEGSTMWNMGGLVWLDVSVP